MTSPTQTLLDLLEQAREADLLSRIEWRDPIAEFGTKAIQAIRPWLADPSTVSFAIRVIERAAAADAEAKELAIEALWAVNGELFVESARRDAADALSRLGSGIRREQPRRERARPNTADPIPALIRGYLYTRRELRATGLLGNLYSGISYSVGGDHVCLFSGGENSVSYGYRDMPSGDNRYRYYGEWRGARDMTLTGGNLAILDRSPNIYLFVNQGGGRHRFEGRFQAIEHERVVAAREGTIGEAIVFTLERVAEEVRL
jgi:hypothetical protein